MADRLGYELELIRCVQYRQRIIIEPLQVAVPLVLALNLALEHVGLKVLEPHAF